MFSPYEELEFLADYLPDEGETVAVTRQNGELVCKPWQRDQLRDGVDEADLYGRLVQANERLAASHALPLWAGLIGLIWLSVGLYLGFGLTWSQWLIIPAVSLPTVYGCIEWGRARQTRKFRCEILPGLRLELTRRKITPFQLISGVRQHAELRNLLDELIGWTSQVEPIAWEYR